MQPPLLGQSLHVRSAAALPSVRGTSSTLSSTLKLGSRSQSAANLYGLSRASSPGPETRSHAQTILPPPVAPGKRRPLAVASRSDGFMQPKISTNAGPLPPLSSLRPETVQLQAPSCTPAVRRSSGFATTASTRAPSDFGGLQVTQLSSMGFSTSSSSGFRGREFRDEDDLLRALDDGSLADLPPAWSRPISTKAREPGTPRTRRRPEPSASRSGSPFGGTWPLHGDSVAGVSDSDLSMLRIVSLMEWLSDRGLSAPSGGTHASTAPSSLGPGFGYGSSSDMMVQGRSVTRGNHIGRFSRPDKYIVDQIMQWAEDGNLTLEDIGQDLRIWQLKLLPRPARRRLLNLMGHRIHARPGLPEWETGKKKKGGAEGEDSGAKSKSKYDPDAAFRNYGGGRGGRDGDDDEGGSGGKYGGGSYRPTKPRDKDKTREELDDEAEAARLAAEKAKRDAERAAAADRSKSDQIDAPPSQEVDEDAAGDAGKNKKQDDDEKRRQMAADADRRRREAEDDARAKAERDARRRREEDEARRKRDAKKEGEEGQEEDALPEEPLDPFALFRVKADPGGKDGDFMLLPFFGPDGKARRDAAGEDGDSEEEQVGSKKKKKGRPTTTGTYGSRFGTLAAEFRQAVALAWKPYLDARWGDIVEPDADACFDEDGFGTLSSSYSGRDRTSTEDASPAGTGFGTTLDVLATNAAGRDAPSSAPARDEAVARPFTTSVVEGEGTPGRTSPSSALAASAFEDGADGSGMSEDDMEAMLQSVLQERRRERYRRKLESRGDAAIGSNAAGRWERRVQACHRSLDSLHPLSAFPGFSAAAATRHGGNSRVAVA